MEKSRGKVATTLGLEAFWDGVAVWATYGTVAGAGAAGAAEVSAVVALTFGLSAAALPALVIAAGLAAFGDERYLGGLSAFADVMPAMTSPVGMSSALLSIFVSPHDDPLQGSRILATAVDLRDLATAADLREIFTGEASRETNILVGKTVTGVFGTVDDVSSEYHRIFDNGTPSSPGSSAAGAGGSARSYFPGNGLVDLGSASFMPGGGDYDTVTFGGDSSYGGPVMTMTMTINSSDGSGYELPGGPEYQDHDSSNYEPPASPGDDSGVGQPVEPPEPTPAPNTPEPFPTPEPTPAPGPLPTPEPTPTPTPLPPDPDPDA